MGSKTYRQTEGNNDPHTRSCATDTTNKHGRERARANRDKEKTSGEEREGGGGEKGREEGGSDKERERMQRTRIEELGALGEPTHILVEHRLVAAVVGRKVWAPRHSHSHSHTVTVTAETGKEKKLPRHAFKTPREGLQHQVGVQFELLTQYAYVHDHHHDITMTSP